MALFKEIPRASNPTNQQLLEYIYALEEQLRYVINNLGSENLLADSVTAEQIQAGSVTTDKVSANFGKTLDLSSNENIILLVKRSDDQYTQLDVRTGQIEAKIVDGVEKLRNTYVLIDNEGIVMSGKIMQILAGATLKIDSQGSVQIGAVDSENSYIQLGQLFSVSYSGGLTAGKADVQSLTVGGKNPWTEGNLIISATKPAVSPCIWLQPNGTTNLEYGADGTSQYFANGSPSLSLAKETTGTFGASAEYNYQLTTKVSNTTGSYIGSVTFTAIATNGASTVNLGSVTEEIGAYDAPIMNFNKVASVNLCANNNPITLTITASRSPAGLRMHPGYKNKMTCTAAQQAGAATCTVHWCP